LLLSGINLCLQFFSVFLLLFEGGPYVFKGYRYVLNSY
jgi:hypothetical protein